MDLFYFEACHNWHRWHEATTDGGSPTVELRQGTCSVVVGGKGLGEGAILTLHRPQHLPKVACFVTRRELAVVHFEIVGLHAGLLIFQVLLISRLPV